MNNSTVNQTADHSANRGGSTLVIVIALLGMLAFMGILFYSFAAQERAASENFSEAAKFAVDEPPNVFDHMLRQVIVGPNDRPSDRTSILRSSTRRHSMVTNLVGSDIHPHTGEGVLLAEDGSGIPYVDQDGDLQPDFDDWNGNGQLDPALGEDRWLDFVDSPIARPFVGYRERGLDGQTAPPAPDVDYTYPDINNLFLAYRGTAIRDNGPSTPPGTPRYEQVKVLIPSFHRPQYLKSVLGNGPNGNSVPTDNNWVSAFDGVDRNTAVYAGRSFRPHPQHIAGRLPDGTIVYRYVTTPEASALGLNGGFPFLPAEETNSGNGTAVRGEMGVWTGSHPDVYELDADNDGDGTKEGIWLDLNYPIQETSDGTKYAILHSVTIYDLDSLIDVNVHGNLAGLSRLGDLTATGTTLVRDGLISNQFVSRSNLGLGPNEINPLWAMRQPLTSLSKLKDFGDPTYAAIREAIKNHYGRTTPASIAALTDLELANMEWLWLMTGRGVFVSNNLDNIFAGRWGEAERVYNTYKSGGSFNVADLPRPGRSGAAQESGQTGIRFGGSYKGAGRNGFDDNQDRLEGEADLSQRRLRASGTPMDYAGTGRTTTGAFQYDSTMNTFAVANSPRAALLHHDPTGSGPERWLGYYGYNLNRGMDDTVPRYAFGQNGVFDQGLPGSDDLVEDPFYDALFEDPLETVFDPNYAQRQFDQVFSPGDLLELHIPRPTKGNYGLSQRLSTLAPFSLQWENSNTVREKFTTLSNSLRRFMLHNDLGADMLPNTADDGPRAWEFSADADGNSDNNGYGQGDGKLEFPPAYGTGVGNGKPFSPTDPFRPQVRRLLTVEAGEGRELIGQLPLSLNHILDVERSSETPDDQSPEQRIAFLRYMRRAGLRFRPLTEHPSATEGTTVLGATSVPTYDPASRVVFPPVTPEQREFWARRDRQQLCRDVYVLLYTIGGAQRDSSNTKIRSYLGTNDPNAAEGAALYTHQQLREMAQFAVNLVDAMDTDDVITKFEYDKNLGPDGSGTGGWNLDDDPYTMEVNALGETDPNFDAVTDNGRHREDSVARGVVYGVEAQQVAFSEVLGVGAAMPAATSDHPATLYADETGRHHLFIELQNLSPMAVELATSESTTMNNAVWRIVRHDRTSANDPMGGKNNGGNPFRAFAFLGKSSVNQTIPAGQRYSIAAASDSSVVSSDLYVDHNLDNTFDLIAPNAGGPALPTNTTNKTDPNAPELKPRSNLDLVHPDHNLAYLMVDQAGNQTSTAGAFLETLQTYSGNTAMTNLHAGDFSMSGQEGFDLVLQRRANPNMPSLKHGTVVGEDANPWVDVDIINVEFRDLAIQDGDMSNQLQQTRLPSITSEERSEPLSDGSRALYAGPPPANLRYNTISKTNSSTTGGFTLWQSHFDRDYASSGELLSLPLCGPAKLTSMIARLGDSPTLQATPPGATNPTPALLVAAASKFLRADFPNDNGQSVAVNRARDNRWYRLLQFVEVPSRVHRMLGNYVALDRVPGKLNLNTLRHWEVYAGLIDNPILLDRDPNPTGNNRITVDRTLDQNGSPVNRDRWQEFLLSRDGGVTASYDPVAGSAKNMLLPGTAKARPFRSPGYRKPLNGVVEGDNGQDATVLRTLRDDVLDSDVATNRHWLEVNDPQQHKTPRPTSLMHQHQVLSKIMNNTTTVSNTFIVYATAGYFEAVEHKVGTEGTGLYRIGSRIDIDVTDGQTNINPGWQQRAVFIIDRTEAFKAYDPGSGDFDWKRLVKSSTMIE